MAPVCSAEAITLLPSLEPGMFDCYSIQIVNCSSMKRWYHIFVKIEEETALRQKVTKSHVMTVDLQVLFQIRNPTMSLQQHLWIF